MVLVKSGIKTQYIEVKNTKYCAFLKKKVKKMHLGLFKWKKM